jgi:hypothetical protein
VEWVTHLEASLKDWLGIGTRIIAKMTSEVEYQQQPSFKITFEGCGHQKIMTSDELGRPANANNLASRLGYFCLDTGDLSE